MKKKFLLALLALTLAAGGAAAADDALPASFDLRSGGAGLVPPIRHQGSWGTCWAHAEIAAAEGNYLARLANGEYSSNFLDVGTEDIDLSEMYLVWFTRMAPQRHQRFTTYKTENGKSVKVDNPTPVQVMRIGAMDFKGVAVMARGAGWSPVLEKDCPYIDNDKYGYQAVMDETGWDWWKDQAKITAECNRRTNEWGKANLVGKKPTDFKTVLRLTDASYLNPKNRAYLFKNDRDAIKRLLMRRGMLYICYYTAADSRFYGNGAYYYATKSLSNRSKDKTTALDPRRHTNHAVALVGWDDDYPVENFTGPEQPKNPGAWLVRNSWGTDAYRHDGGYFWMSYEQHVTCGMALTMEEPNANMKTYEYDDLGWCGVWGSSGNSGNPSRAANVFRVGSDGEALSEIGFYTTGVDATVSFAVYGYGSTHPGANIEGGTRLASVPDTNYTLPGYHTVKLSSPVNLKKGDYFSVVLTATNPTDSNSVAVEKRLLFDTDYARIGDRESYFLQDGKWFDGAFHAEKLIDGTSRAVTPMNACIKAFTIDSVPTDKPLPDKYGDYDDEDDGDTDGDKSDETVTFAGVKVEKYPTPTVTVSSDSDPLEGRQVTVTLVSNDKSPLRSTTADIYYVLVEEDWDEDDEEDAETTSASEAAFVLAEDKDFQVSFDEFLQDEDYMDETSPDVDPFYSVGFKPDRIFMKDGVPYPVYGPVSVTTNANGSVTLDADDEKANLPEGYYNVLYKVGVVTGDLPMVHFTAGGVPDESEDDDYWLEDEDSSNSSTGSARSGHNGCDAGLFGAAGLISIIGLAELRKRK